MHSQAQLIQHLQAIKAAIIERTADARTSEGCICASSGEAVRGNEDDAMHVAVKQLVSAEFKRRGLEQGGCSYLYPVRPTNNTSYIGDVGGYYGTPEDVAAGKVARLELIDRWIADAQKKLVAAVFRKAVDSLTAGADTYMCCAIRHSVSLLLDVGHSESFKHPMTVECQAVLNRFAPQSPQYAWFPTTPQHTALRVAILNLCITEVTRGFK